MKTWVIKALGGGRSQSSYPSCFLILFALMILITFPFAVCTNGMITRSITSDRSPVAVLFNETWQAGWKKAPCGRCHCKKDECLKFTVSFLAACCSLNGRQQRWTGRRSTSRHVPSLYGNQWTCVWQRTESYLRLTVSVSHVGVSEIYNYCLCRLNNFYIPPTFQVILSTNPSDICLCATPGSSTKTTIWKYEVIYIQMYISITWTPRM